jgi:hypothetical protein
MNAGDAPQLETFRGEREPIQPIEPASALPGEGTAWIRCKAYRMHQLNHHRDPETGVWRCYLCQPEGVDR